MENDFLKVKNVKKTHSEQNEGSQMKRNSVAFKGKIGNVIGLHMYCRVFHFDITSTLQQFLFFGKDHS